jgi:hypothetical protein
MRRYGVPVSSILSTAPSKGFDSLERREVIINKQTRNYGNEGLSPNTLRELAILHSLSQNAHKNILAFHNLVHEKLWIYTIFESADEDLKSLLTNCPNGFSNDRILVCIVCCKYFKLKIVFL